MTNRNTPKRKRLTRDRIIAAAVESFHENGYEKTTLADVADKLSVTDKAIYYYFDSKDTLFLTVQNMRADRMAELITAISRGPESGLAKFKSYSIAVIRQLSNLYPYDRTLPHHLAETEEAIRFHATERSNDEAVIGWIKEGITDGSILPGNPKMLWKWNEGGMLWLGLSFGKDGEFELRALEDHTMRMVDRSLARAAPPDAAAPVPTP